MSRKSERQLNNGGRESGRNRLLIDYNLLLIIVVLISFGLVMLYSTSYYVAEHRFGDDMFFLKKQVIAAVCGFVAMFAVALVMSRTNIILNRFVIFMIWLFSMGLMFLVRTPFGYEANGAKRWIQVPVIGTIQPSETAKIAVILVVSAYIVHLGARINHISGMVKTLFLAGITAAGVYLFTDHLSGALIVMAIACILILVVHRRGMLLSITAVIAGAFGYQGLRLYAEKMERIYADNMSQAGTFRFIRLLVWAYPENHSSEGGYQILQGLYAIGSGGFLGKGLGNSSQKLGFIPEAQNDMIIAIVCEELGVIGLIILLILFAYLIYRLMFIAQNAPDLISSLIVTGIMAHIALQLILNICVIVNAIPTTGITVPFISYGGSSLVFLMAEMGLAMGISARIQRQALLEEQLGEPL